VPRGGGKCHQQERVPNIFSQRRDTVFHAHQKSPAKKLTMRVCGVLLLLSAAARGLVSKAGSESQSPTEQRRLQRQNVPLHDRNGLGLTPPGLFCRGGSAATGRGEAAGCLAKQIAGRGALPVAAAGSEKPLGAKQGWGQLRRSPEAGGSLSTELASRGVLASATYVTHL